MSLGQRAVGIERELLAIPDDQQRLIPAIGLVHQIFIQLRIGIPTEA